MQEKILLAPGVNAAELRRTLARYGQAYLGLRVMNGPQLARYALMRQGVAVPETIVSREDEMSLVAEAMRGVSYFGQIGLADVRGMTQTLREIRQIAVEAGREEAEIIAESLCKGPFAEKNTALRAVYTRYMARLQEEGWLDRIALMRKALAECGALQEEILSVQEIPLSPLEAALAEKLSGGSARKKTWTELFEAEPSGPRVTAYYKAYGKMAEVDTALQAVVRGEAAADDLTVAVTDPGSYAQLFFDRMLMTGIPVSFGTGIPIGNSFPAQLLLRYVHWATDGFFGKAALEAMLESEAFDRSRLPLSSLADELELPAAAFLQKYAFLRPLSDDPKDRLLHNLDKAALKEIRDELELAARLGQDGNLSVLCSRLMTRNICRESSRPGAVHVCGIREAALSLRPRLFVMGLSAALYPGGPRENHLLLDADITAFPSNPKDRTSKGRIYQKQEDFRALLRLAAAAGSCVSLSYPYYDTAELKSANASSLLPEIYTEERGTAGSYEAFAQALQEIRYFDNTLSVDKAIGQAVSEGKRILPAERPAEAAPAQEGEAGEPGEPQEPGEIRYFSPSALKNFYECPRRFYLKTMLGIPEPEEEKPFEILPANEAGTLAHSLMERLAEEAMPKEAFLQLAEAVLEQFLKERPPLTGQGLAREKKDFLDMMATAWEQDQDAPRNAVVSKEEHVDAVHAESGIGLHGFPDRVELIAPGVARIVDFKTGRKNEYKPDDIDSCLQVVVYAFLTEAAFPDLKVQDCEYRLIRRGETVSCRYDDAMKQALTEKLRKLKDALERGDFPVSENAGVTDEKKGIEDPCKYCRYALICGKTEELTGEEEE